MAEALPAGAPATGIAVIPIGHLDPAGRDKLAR